MLNKEDSRFTLCTHEVTTPASHHFGYLCWANLRYTRKNHGPPVKWMVPLLREHFSDAGSASGKDAECAVYTAPLCYPGICEPVASEDPTVDIFVKRLPATAGDAKTATNVWLIQGGPGYSSTTTAQVTTTGSMLGREMDPSEVPSCAQDLAIKYGDLASFSTTSAASDIAAFISKYSNGAATIVYGVSYGTVVVERLIHLNPTSVTGYVLDGIATSSGASGNKFEYFSMWDADFGEVGERFLDLCMHDSVCGTHFNTSSLSSTLHDMLVAFDSNPNSTCAELVSNMTESSPPSVGVRSTLAMLLKDPDIRALIPPIVYRLNRCDSNDIDVLSTFFGSMSLFLTSAASQDDAFQSTLLYYLIVFSDMWETPAPSTDTMEARFMNASIADGMYAINSLYCAFTKEKSPVCDELGVGNYDGNGIIYQRDQYWNKTATVPSQASVLLLSGKLDPQTPHKYAEYLFDALDGPKKELIAFDYATHGIIMSTPMRESNGTTSGSKNCGMELLASYVSGNGDLDRLDRSCIDEVPAFNFTISMDIMSFVLGTEDAYDGTYNSSVICVCAGTPLPIIILVISQEALPLANPTDGWAANWGFWVRAAILGGVNAVAISGHLKYLLQGIDETLCQLALQFVSVAVGYTAASVIVASLLVFPIPYMIIVMTPAFLVLLMGSMRAILGPTIFQNIVRNKAQFWRYTNAVYVQVLMAVTYPTYQALFNTVSGSAYELPVFLLLPVIKLVLKNLVALCLVGVDDLIPENVIFTVHFFNAVYLATSMQSASSTLAVVIVIIIDLTETSLALRGIYRRLNRIMNQLRCIIGPSGGEDTFLSATRSLCNFHEKFTKEERAQVQVRSFFSHGLSPAASEFLASLDNSALTFGPSFQSSTQSMPTIQTIPSDTKPSRFRVLFSQQWLEGAIVQPIDPTAKVNVKVNSVHNKQSRSGRAVAAVPSVMHIAILRKALATLSPLSAWCWPSTLSLSFRCCMVAMFS
ncbi:unnamed protein product [Phytophthora lilii]|uniref:Unnamed protein product n=1 Tax=Phytophthora lilii TaxID=2077276 RepID=A0A9W6TXB4_9STRA|nr:unnamed protein product [Phytophthora lilii]